MKMKYHAPAPAAMAATSHTAWYHQVRKENKLARHPGGTSSREASWLVGDTVAIGGKHKDTNPGLGARALRSHDVFPDAAACYARAMRRTILLATVFVSFTVMRAAAADAPKPETLLQELKAWLEPAK